MLNNISFKGQVIESPKFGRVSQTDKEKIQEYADKYDVDVHLL